MNAQELVINKLHSLVDSAKGLPVTHETPKANIKQILKDKSVKGDYGVFFTVGHLKKPQFVIGAGYLIHGYIKPSDVNANVIVPDMRFTGLEDEEGEPYEDSWEALWNESRGMLFGYEIASNYEEWPASQWSKIIDNRAGKQVWPQIQENKNMRIKLSELRQIVKGAIHKEILKERLEGESSERIRSILTHNVYELITSGNKETVIKKIIEEINSSDTPVIKTNEQALFNMISTSIKSFLKAPQTIQQKYVTIDEKKLVDDLLFDQIKWLWIAQETGPFKDKGPAPSLSSVRDTVPQRARAKRQ